MQQQLENKVAIVTGGGSGIDAPMQQQIAAMHSIGRLGRAAEIAELVLWLASPQASFVSGAYYPVDGGYLVQ